MTEIYFVRHGQASFGAENYDKLSTIGHKQSELLGLHLKKTSLKFDKVICGKMKRHQDQVLLLATHAAARRSTVARRVAMPRMVHGHGRLPWP